MSSNALPRQFALDLGRAHQASLGNFLPGSDRALISTLQKITEQWAVSTATPVIVDVNPLNHRWIYWWGAPWVWAQPFITRPHARSAKRFTCHITT